MFERFNKVSNTKRSNYILILYINLLLISFTICANDCSGCHYPIASEEFPNIQTYYYQENCNINCRFSARKNQWYYCHGFQSSSSKYFYINSNNECFASDNCQITVGESLNQNENKVVLPSLECIQSCNTIDNQFINNIYELGDFCIYENRDIYTNHDLYDIMNVGYKILKCKGCALNETIDKSNFTTCKDCDDCPTGWHDLEEKACIKDADSCNIYKKIKEDHGKFQCRSSCSDFEYRDPTTGRTYCLDKCPTNAKFYVKEVFGASKCRENCDNYYIDSDDEEIKYRCVSECNDGLIYKEEYKVCKKGPSPLVCPSSHPYTYLNYCFKSCADSQSLIDEKTYSVLDEDGQSEKKCVTNCYAYDQSLKVDENTLSCVKSECKETRNKYTHNLECLSECPPEMLYNADDLKCVDECEDNYYKLNNVCYKDRCPEYSDKPFYDDNKQCVACSSEIEGYYVKKYDDEEGDPRCYKSCPEGYYLHYYDDNICYKSGGADDTCENIGIKAYPYHKKDDFTCYPSCQSISGDYKFEKDYKCLTESEYICPSDYFYYKNEGMTVCVHKDKYIKQCAKNGYNYLRERECVKKCDDDEYTVNYIETIYDGMVELGRCCKDPSNCKNGYKFYSKTEKIIRKDCKYKRIKNKDDDPIESSDGNCVIKCPSDYPCEYNDGICIESCDAEDFYYFSEDGTKKCIDNCRKLGMYHFKDEKECRSKCEKDGKSYYYDKDFICYEKCEEAPGKPFSFKVIDEPQECLENCPPDYPNYFENDKFCLPKCDEDKNEFYSDRSKKKCVKKCEGDNDKIVEGNVCSPTCEGTPFFIYQSEGNYCVSDCKNNFLRKEYDYYDSETHECYEDCPPKAPYKIENGNMKICYKECPEGFYIESNVCKNKCDKFHQKNSAGKYECVNNCAGDKFIVSSTRECVDDCPLGENFIGANRYCKSGCSPEDGQFYRSVKPIKDKDDNILSYIYQCHNSLKSNEYKVYQSPETVIECPSNKPYLSVEDRMCYDLCKYSDNQPFSYHDENDEEENEWVCLRNCRGNKINYRNEDKICVEGCDQFQIDKIMNKKNNSCVEKCDTSSSSDYKYENEDEEHKFSCEKKCPDGKKYSKEDYKCVSECKYPYNYNNFGICENNCPPNYFAIPNGDELTCVIKCEEPNAYYYEPDRICREECMGGDYIIQGTNECTNFCDPNGEEMQYHYYIPKVDGHNTNAFDKRTCVTKCPDDRPFLKNNNFCEEKCDEPFFNYYSAVDYKCLHKCQANMKIIQRDTNIFECIENCPLSPTPYFEDVNKTCIESCENSAYGYKYYIPSERKCLPKCEKEYFIDGFQCLTSCPEGKYALGQTCIDKCPIQQPYFVGTFTHGETGSDTQKKCLFNCPKDYPFLKKDDANELYECTGSCDFYKNTTEPKECVEKCDGNYKFFILDEQSRHICLESCPEKSPYYTYDYLEDPNNEENIGCYESCPQNPPTYKKINSFECVKTCTDKIVDYEKKECVYGCSVNQKYSKDNGIKYCLKECNNELGPYLTSGGECVKKCSDYGDNFVIDASSSVKQCICKNLYYIDEEGKTICIPPMIEKCGEYLGTEDYKYRIFNSFQCSKYCFGLLSPDEEICYQSYTNCSHIPNTDISIKSDKRKCDCKYRYYINEGKKVCLNENQGCEISPFLYYIPEEKECVADCQELYRFDFTCLHSCPNTIDASPNSKECITDKKWYKEGESDYHILEEDMNCPKKYPYLIDQTKQCVNNCANTRYSAIYKNTCYSSCEIIPNYSLRSIEPNESSDYYGKALYECLCINKWYIDENGENICQEDDHNECPNDDYFVVKETNQCVAFACPSYYPFSFNKECFRSCTDAKNKYQLPVKRKDNSTSYECVCESLWRYIDDNHIIIECIKDPVCKDDELLITTTNECYKGVGEECPDETPLKFNKKCYNQCPEKTKQDSLDSKKCACSFAWLEQNGNLNCFEDNEECPDSYPYQIVTTKQCIQDNICPEYTTTDSENHETTQQYKSFNYKCYVKCPDGTREVTNDSDNDNDKCECDPKDGYWYKYEDNGKLMFKCAQNNCTENRLFYRNTNKECISKCDEESSRKYDGVCYEECPNPLIPQKNGDIFDCVTKKFTTAENISQSYSFLKEEIINLYKGLPDGGLTYSNFSSTMQIYGIKMKDNAERKNSILRSTLSYIDISSCKEKVFKNNNMKEDGEEDIIVVKYDLENKKQKSLINPVEYEFVSSRTAQVLDMSVCTKEDIVVSYSLANILNYHGKKGNRILQEIDKNYEDLMLALQRQYKMGKEMFTEYNLDTFNINSTLYNDICYSFEIDGKDLVLEDRIKFLYPFYSLCEENCTYSHIDYDLERIYCNCPLKNQFNLDREHEYQINIYDKEDIKSKQKGPTNLPVMTCMSKLSEKNKISKNGGFFFSLIIIILEFILLFVTIFYNYKLLIEKINKHNNDEEEKEEEKEKEDEKEKEEQEKVITIDLNENNKKEKKSKKSKKDKKRDKDKSKKKDNKKKEMKAYKTSKRALEAPPKKRAIKNEDISPEDIKLEKKIVMDEKVEKKIMNNEIDNKINDGTETDDPRLDVDEEDKGSDYFTKNYQLGILDEIQKEEKILRIKYELAINKDKADVFIILLTEICDKIYLFKTLCLLNKYDMFSLYCSAYLSYHLLLLTFITMFYDIKTLENIWNEENYPGLNYDLGYGLLACLIVWVIYKIYLCLLNNDNIIAKYLKGKTNNNGGNITENSDGEKKMKENEKKMKNLLSRIRTGMIAFFVIELILGILCLLYLTTFCAIYTGTKKKIFKTYGIALVEVLIIKILYGITLGILRKVALSKKIRILYKIVYYFDKLAH